MKLLSILCFLTTWLACSGCNYEYSAELNVFTHGTHKILSCRLDAEKVSVVRHSTNNEPDIIIADRKLTVNEKDELKKYFSGFSLSKLEKSYINKEVLGEIHREFKICKNNTCRKSIVYFTEVPLLEELAGKFRMLVPDMDTLCHDK